MWTLRQIILPLFGLLASFSAFQIHGRKLDGSLKWLGDHTNQNFHPERDSFTVPVPIVSGHSQIVILENGNLPKPSNFENRFSLLDLIEKGSQGRRRSSYPHQLLPVEPKNERNHKNDRNSKCGADIPEWNIYHRIFNGTGKCHIPGKGYSPCNENMQFYLINGDMTFGDCDCKMFDGLTYRPMVYWAPLDQCFVLYDQGPCSNGEKLMLDAASTPICQQHNCHANPADSRSWILRDTTCYHLGSQAFCSKNETLQYNFNDTEPNCYDYVIKTRRSILAGPLNLPCKVGHKNYGSSNCKMST